jgi:hypothetical protein
VARNQRDGSESRLNLAAASAPATGASTAHTEATAGGAGQRGDGRDEHSHNEAAAEGYDGQRAGLPQFGSGQ